MFHRARLYVGLLLVFWLLNALVPITGTDVAFGLFLWSFVLGVLFFEIIQIGYHKKIQANRQLFYLMIFFLILASWRIVQLFWSVDPTITIQEAVKTALLGFFVVAVYIGLSRVDESGLERLAATVVSVLLLISFGAYVYLLVYRIGDITYFGFGEAKKYLLLFGGSNTAGAAILLLGAWNWMLVLSKNRRLSRLGLVNFAIAAVTLFGLGSRTAIGGFLLSGIGVLMLLLWKSRRKPFAAVLLAGILGGALLGLIWFTPAIPEADAVEVPRTFFQRVDMWREAWYILSEGTWLAGSGAATNAGLEFTVAGFSLRGGIHNALLQTWLEDGIVGLILYLWLFAWLIREGLYARSAAGAALVAVSVGMFVRNLGESNGLVWGLLNNFLVFASWYTLVHLLVLCRKEPLNQEVNSRQHDLGGGRQLRGGLQSEGSVLHNLRTD